MAERWTPEVEAEHCLVVQFGVTLQRKSRLRAQQGCSRQVIAAAVEGDAEAHSPPQASGSDGLTATLRRIDEPHPQGQPGGGLSLDAA